MTWFLITLAVGTLAGLLLYRLHFPGGMLVGAIAAVCAFNLLTGRAFIYPQAKLLAQLITGTYIGCTVTRRDVLQIPTIIRPFLLVISSMFLLNIAVGLLFHRITDLDLITSLFCAMPGGMSDTPLIAIDMGANGTIVTAMQFVRMIFGLSCLPTLILFANQRLGQSASSTLKHEAPPERAPVPTEAETILFQISPTLCIGIIGGMLGKLSGIPAGTLSFSLIFVASANVMGKARPMPLGLRRLAQIFSGCYIGAGVAAEQLAQLNQMVLPAVILCAAYFLNCICTGLLVCRIFHITLKESMLFLSPAGATEMTLIAADMGIASTKLAVIQICRLVVVTIIFPQLFRILLIFV